MTFRAFVLTALACFIVSPAIAQDDVLPLTEPVELDSANPETSDLGELSYRGGVVIEPGEYELGGISGLEWHEDRLYAVLDDGRWLTITPDEIQGQLVDVLTVSGGPLLDLKGKKLKRKSEADAEAIARAPDGSWLVAFERDHRIWQYGSIDGQASSGSFQVDLTKLPLTENGGIETLATYEGGALICAEQADAATQNCLRTDTSGAAQFTLTPPPAVAEHGGVPTDATCLADGTCYVLFRSYRSDYGNRAGVLELSLSGETRVLAEIAPPLTIDNFEGIAVRQHRGKTFLYLASDNNFSSNQRNLLMKFEVRGATPAPLATAPTGPIEEPEPVTEYDTVDVVLETTLGEITVRLETERAPITAANFLRYIEEDRFDGTVFYRAMHIEWGPQPNGLIQGGTQWDPKRVLPGIQHEPTSETGLSHTRGALSMAMGEPGSANGDFSIMVQDQTGLDAKPNSDDPIWKNGYAVFGYVIEGMAVVEAIHAQPTDPDAGEGWMKGQMLAEPVTITEARRAEAASE
ncbi:esterase-like activity of phytase family protein [uncultured Erythrobacter sp.]|uniref:esterase-like activity of phytase family protein n=1 Tax=uncultured Erythrobacter sp. TaxID=263913 RepID=UPI00260AECA2|nr:esterase-like activity of phytase family protein [uncultured Erythrobacter sp.]